METELSPPNMEYLEGTAEEQDISPELEGDETISLSDVLSSRDYSLSEEELWALCRECCLVLDVVKCSPEMFQTLCITPDTVAFDGSGNVCFLDLETEPEQLYIPPEYERNEQSYKSHLFSLGMTLLYAAEYNGEPGRPEISAEFRQLFGYMTSENQADRPDLETVIIQCEEELVGKSSADICCKIGSFVSHFSPIPDGNSSTLADVTAGLANYLQTQSKLLPDSSALNLTDPQQHSTPATSPDFVSSAADVEEDMALRGSYSGIPTPTGNLKQGSHSRKNKNKTSNNENMGENVGAFKPPIPKKPDLKKRQDNDSGVIDMDLSNNNDNNNESVTKIKPVPQKRKHSDSVQIKDKMDANKSHRARKRQGLTIGEIIEYIDRNVTEEELWALCKEGAYSLQRKRKHLPAYLSLDTLLVRDNGGISFRAIPEDKPLEVIFMSPELQQKGELSEKACLYGLGTTARCAADGKFTPAAALNVSAELKELLCRLVHPDTQQRPSIDETLEICGIHDGRTGESSTLILQNLFQDAHVKIIEQEESSSKPELKQEEVDTGSAFRPIKMDVGSAFVPKKPVPVKPEEPKPIPAAYRSTATHFKPIIIQRTETPIEKKEMKKESSPTADCHPSEKDKEVVKKLKELKKNLMKHRQSIGGKDSETETKTPPRSPKPLKSSHSQNLKKSANQKSSSDDSNDDKSKEGMGALESLLLEVQKRGTQVDTDTLASAIAQHLQNHMTKSESNRSQVNTEDWVQNQNNQFVNPQMPPPQLWPNLNIPSQYQQHLVGQTVTLPQYGGGLMPGYPMQVQLQQDPRTGFVQLIPVGMPVQFPQPALSEYGADYGHLSDSGKSQKMHANYSTMNPSPMNTSGEMDSSPNVSRTARPGRAAKNLLQKTANMRAKNTGRVQSVRQADCVSESSSLWRSKSAHALNGDHFHSDGESIKQQSSRLSAFQVKSGSSYDDTMLHVNNHTNIHSQFTPLQHTSNQPIPQSGGDNQTATQPLISESQSSSPSASKDSGISSMNGAYKPPPAGSMVERLLNNVHSSQQEKLGRVIHLLREEFAFDGYMENGVEDLATAEYIASLGSLKWETFASAITEKYCDIYWAPDLLMSLYDAVNSSSNRSPQVQPTVSMDTSFKQNQRDLPSQRPLSLHSRLHQQETSDSTDNENYERRRRPRRRHHHDKAKTNSEPNISSEKSLSLPNNVDRLSDDTLVDLSDSYNDQTIEREVTPVIGNNQNSVGNEESNHRLTLDNHSDSQRSHPSHDSTEDSNRSDSQTERSEHGIYRKNKKINQNRLLSTDSGMLSKGSNLTRHLSQLSLVDNLRSEIPPHTRKCNVVYHYSTMQLNFTSEVEKFVQSIDEENSTSLQSELSALEQQIMMEKRQKKKSENFYFKLTEGPKSEKGEQKSTLQQVCKDLDEMAAKIHFLQLCKTHIQMSLSELYSIHPTYLYSVVTCEIDQPVKLKPCQENPLLQYQIIREPQTGCEIQALHAGTIEGLMSYLFSSTALSFGYIHQFLFCFRYFVSQTELLNFLMTKYRCAKSSGKSGETNLTRMRQRILYLLYFWIEGFYSVDFDENTEIVDDLQNFLEESGIKPSSEYEEPSLQDLLNSCLIGQNIDLISGATDDNIHVYNPGMPKKWDTLKSVVRSKSGKSVLPHVKPGPVKTPRRGSVEIDLKLSRRTDNFTLTDYTPQKLAEQLTLIEQGFFQHTHPVHYLNSKAQGVGVSLTLAKSRAPSTFKLTTTDNENPSTSNLFVCDTRNESNIQQMIEFSNQVSHWVAAEIVSCSSGKSQTAVLSKLLYTAQICKDMRNYATCTSILEGLENLVIKQLPIWKNLPTKCVNAMEDLKAARLFLKSDTLALVNNKDSHLYPTIPSVVLLLLHVQQCEIGGFKLANGMFKWSKMRSICNAIDQVRIFKNHLYGFDPDMDVQEVLIQRMQEFSDQDVHLIAAQHDTNYHKMSSGGIVGAFRKMKGKLQSK